MSRGKREGSSGGGIGSWIGGLVVAIVLVFVGLYFVAQFTPMFGNITNPGGVVGTFLTMAEWIIPLLAIVGLIVWGISKFLKK